MSKAFVEDTVPNAEQELELFIRIRHRIPDQLWYVQYGTVHVHAYVPHRSSDIIAAEYCNDVILNHEVVAQHLDSSLIKVIMLNAATVPT